MSETSQKRAVRSYRSRLGERGMARFEVVGRDADRALIRRFAQCLADDGPAAERLRAAVNADLGGGGSSKGGILAVLRRSPLVGADILPVRPMEPGRKVDL